MPIKSIFSVIAGLLYIIAFGFYIRAILRNEIKPAKASWLIWATLNTIIIAGMYAEGSVDGQIVGALIGGWVTVVLVLKRGTPGWSTLDKFSLSGAGVGIVLWQVFNDPILGIMISLVVTFIGAIPTFVSAWRDPSREDKVAWTIFESSCIFALPAIPAWTLADAAQPLTFFTIQTIMMYLLYIRPRWKKNN